LGLDRNKLIVLPESIGQLSTSLKKLSLSLNRLTALPESIGQLSSLQFLDLTFNQLTTLPESISQLSSLQALFLSYNQLTVLPESIGQLFSLQVLALVSNQLTVLPESIGQLSASLKNLALSHNQLTMLPKSIGQLTNLLYLNLDDNPLPDLSPEIMGESWNYRDKINTQVVLTYLATLAKIAKRPLNELKLLLVGEGDVGKTSLMNRLIHDTFNPHEPKTPGINIEKLELSECPELRFNLWDFGGQRVMHTTHQFFLTQRSLYLLVIDNRKNEQQNRVEYWLKLIQTYGGNSPVILVGNCTDEHPAEVKVRTLKKKYPQVIGLIETSCKTGAGIRELRYQIAQQVESIPHIRDELPVTWFEIKTQLEEMQKTYDFISYEKYQQLCQQAEITGSDEQKVLVRYLHDLGIVLNYQEDPRLNETNVLNPEWVTSGVYDILNNHDLMVKEKGILSLSKLSSILQQIDRYPESKRTFLMSLMEKFELCFPLDGFNPPRYLITDLLPIDEPDVDIYEKAPLHFQYKYDILPSSIISRFIVRNHTMIHSNTRWRSGVVLKQDSSKALVRSDEEENRISIKVQNERAGALLSTIRADFNRIHATLPNLAVQEFLIVQETVDAQPTGREVPIDYLYLITLENQGEMTVTLPNLDGQYNLHDLLNGVESHWQREQELTQRRKRGRKSIDFRPLEPLEPSEPLPEARQTLSLARVSGIMFCVLAGISTIFAILAHFIPALQLTIIVVAIILLFALITITALRWTGVISEEIFNQAIDGLLKKVPNVGGNPEPPAEDAPKLPEK
jgi:internalin A